MFTPMNIGACSQFVDKYVNDLIGIGIERARLCPISNLSGHRAGWEFSLKAPEPGQGQIHALIMHWETGCDWSETTP